MGSEGLKHKWWIKNSHIYKQFPTIDKKCMPIEQKIQKYILEIIIFISSHKFNFSSNEL
jgi:hypothetical protein